MKIYFHIILFALCQLAYTGADAQTKEPDLVFYKNFEGKYGYEILSEPVFTRRLQKLFAKVEDYDWLTSNLMIGNNTIIIIGNKYAVITGEGTADGIRYEAAVVVDIANNFLFASITNEHGKAIKVFREPGSGELPPPLKDWLNARQ